MSRRRYVSTDISLDERLEAVSDRAALLYTWMIPQADDGAYIKGDPERIRLMVAPRRKRWTTSTVANALGELEEAGLFEWWDKDSGVVYFPPESFYRFQSYIKEEKRRLAGVFLCNSAERRKTPQNAVSPSPSPSPSGLGPVGPSPSPEGSRTSARELPVENVRAVVRAFASGKEATC